MDKKTTMSSDKEQAVLDYHSSGRKGKIEVIPTKMCNSQRDLSLAYSPGVAVPCMRIKNNIDDAYEYTAKGNLVAVISNGTAVLGLGNIGALASKPVMEGKGILFKKFADIDVFDIEVNTEDPDEFIRTVKLLEPTFGGINLEDIKAPECFYIEEKLKEICNIPVFHDDQHGTAIISAAALLNSLELVNKNIDEIKVVFSGAGAAAISCANLYISLGVKKENLIMCDINGVIYKDRKIEMDKYKSFFASDTNARTLSDVIKGADVFAGLSAGGVLTKTMVASMADNPIVFAMANPNPEISYEDAISSRKDIIIATGRSDFPNQVNNVIGFPFLFRGALDSRATSINEEMKIAAVKAIVKLTKEPIPENVLKAYNLNKLSFGRDYIIPKPLDPRILIYVAPAVAKAAMDSGVSRKKLDIEKYKMQLKKIHGPKEFTITQIINRIRNKKYRLVFPEGANEKIIKASYIISEEGIAQPVLLGNKTEILEVASRYNINLSKIEIVEPNRSLKLDSYAEELFNLRQRKGIVLSTAKQIMRNTIYYAMMMLEKNDVDGLICGVDHHYPETLRPALEILKLRENLSFVSSFYLIIMPDQTFLFSDPSVNIEPTENQLAEIAINTAKAAKTFGLEPKVAMLSFSNFGSVNHKNAIKMRNATRRAKELDPSLIIDGEMQADTALCSDILKELYPFSKLKDKANVLIFPELQSANISLKLVEGLAKADIIGPILTGVTKPINAIVRGSSVENIVNVAAITALEIDSETF